VTRWGSLRQSIVGAARFGLLAADAARVAGLLGAVSPLRLAEFGLRCLGRPWNPSAVINLHALNSPDRDALIDGERRFTYRQLDERVDRLAAALDTLGVGAGERVAVMLRNGHEYLETQWAVTRRSAVLVQIGYRLKAAEVAYILEHSAARVLICGRGEEGIAREAAAAARHTGRIVVAGAEYEALLAAADPRARPAAPTARDAGDPGAADADDKGGVMIYTSGTTGKPKGAARSFKNNMHESAADFLRQLRVHHDDRHLVVCPLYHSAAPAFVLFVLIVGGTIVIEEHFEPEHALDLIVRERVTSSFMVPTMLARLAATAAAHPGRWPTGSLRWLASGAAPLPTETARRVEATFGRILYNFYGATETGLVTLALPGEHTARPGTIGRKLSGNEIRLLGEDGREVAPGQVGELYVRNSMLVGGYHRDRDATARAMKDGFFSVGDMARVDSDGYYFLADRKTDMVISGGVNIYPLEIEHRLHAHPAVLEVAVIGVPDDEWGESLKAFVVPRPGHEVTADELRGFCKLTLANYKCPKHFEFVDALPRNPTGKVLKRELRTR
jgi:fatty-acyl-CoA synthase